MMSAHTANSSTPLTLASRLPSAAQNGFSLVEMAIVLVIVGFLLAGGLTIYSSQQNSQHIEDTQTLLDTAKEALIGYAASHAAADGHPYLPCPDTTGDGQEDRTAATGDCVNTDGNLPWVTLGLTETDSWGNRLRYHVEATGTPKFSNSLAGMSLTSTGAITINNAAGTALATSIPAVILSHGKNGYGAQNAAGGANQAPTGASELENTNTNATFISNTPVGTGGTGGEFDDIVTWLSPNVLFNRMLAAGKLP